MQGCACVGEPFSIPKGRSQDEAGYDSACREVREEWFQDDAELRIGLCPLAEPEDNPQSCDEAQEWRPKSPDQGKQSHVGRLKMGEFMGYDQPQQPIGLSLFATAGRSRKPFRIFWNDQSCPSS
jgi:hypothetical protein